MHHYFPAQECNHATAQEASLLRGHRQRTRQERSHMFNKLRGVRDSAQTSSSSFAWPTGSSQQRAYGTTHRCARNLWAEATALPEAT